MIEDIFLKVKEMFLGILLEAKNYNLLDWVQLLGGIIAFILAGLSVKEHYKKRVSIKLNLKQEAFSSSKNGEWDIAPQTYIGINVDVTNAGLEPTTISGATFFCPVSELNDIKMVQGSTTDFTPVRMEPNHRQEIKLRLSKDFFLPTETKELDAEIVFKTPHKDIKKKIHLTKSY